MPKLAIKIITNKIITENIYLLGNITAAFTLLLYSKKPPYSELQITNDNIIMLKLNEYFEG